MNLSLENGLARFAYLLAILLIAGSLAYPAGNVWRATYLGASWEPARLLRAAYLEPTNATYWYRLGLYEKWDFERHDLNRAIAYFERATEANPRSDTLWMDLAEAYEAVGQPKRAREAFDEAQSAHPISPNVAWRYGNFLLRLGDYPEAFAEMRRALVGDPDFTVQAVSECSKTGGDLPAMLTEVLPNQTRYYLTAMDYFLSQHQIDAAVTVWNRLLALNQSAQMPQAVPLIDGLIGEQRLEDALGVWRRAMDATHWPQDPQGNSSIVFNGGFEHDLLNGAFDWREDPISGAVFRFDENFAHAGKRALRIDFDGTANVDFQNLRQLCPVEPGRSYHFAAYVRLDEISTDSGIRFAIYDTFHPASLQILTPDLVGSHPWSLIEADLITGYETHLVTIAVRRLPSWKFDNKLRGTVWVDDVSLMPVPENLKEIRR